ncbi:hypothetical protein [Pseudomonas lundensis]|uniref:hypothetical protein n=1 Tax=Pseudomonas lundensis TaxID=86185 RepID=UPI00147666DF|nr:hypothetical protein [Pseudomonas lundensis]NNA39261.1 hypothetical protein [Pseudomonas lundensis]
MTVTARQMRESAMRAPTAEQRRIELDAARQAERRESEAVYGEAGPLVLELQQKLAESERSAVRERLRAEKFEGRVRDLQKAIKDATGCDVSRWACGFDGAIRAGISDEARRQVSGQSRSPREAGPVPPARPAEGKCVCPGCGSKGFTANCNQCIPY